MDRVKFHSANDLSNGHYLNKSEKLIQEYIDGREIQDINDIIEIWNVDEYLTNKLYLLHWTESEIGEFENVVKSYRAVIAKYFKSLTDATIEMEYSRVDIYYRNDFWELVCKFKTYNQISHEKFSELLCMPEVHIFEIIKHKKLVEHFSLAISKHMLSDCSTAELLISKYEMRHHNDSESEYFFPKDLSNKDKETILINYIASENPNLNYLRLISNLQSNKDRIEVSAKTLLKAKKRIEELEKDFFNHGSGIEMGVSVSFSKLQEDAVDYKFENNSTTAVYSTKWIDENLDYTTLLNNFIYLFEFVDMQMRCLFVNKFNHMGVFERFLLTTSRNGYYTGIAFEQMNILSFLQIKAYYNELFSHGIRLEEVIEWFFKEYLGEEFGATGFNVTMPSTNSSYLEKCTNIMPAMESVLKQFSLYVHEGQIDFELLEIGTEHLIYKNIPSLVERKYVYGASDEFNIATSLLFSDQSSLGYNEKLDKNCNTFYELLCCASLQLSDFADYNAPKIEWLIEHDFISINDTDNQITYNNTLISVLRDLYYNEVISYWRYPEPARHIIEALHLRDVVSFESTLFSRPEQDYINFLLNKSQFNNGWDLRNRYVHSQPYSKADEKMHNQNYMIFLRLFVVSVIKINDDFCLSESIRKIQNPIL